MVVTIQDRIIDHAVERIVKHVLGDDDCIVIHIYRDKKSRVVKEVPE